MVKYLFQRVVAMVLSLFCLATIAFFLMHSIPGGPFTREKPLPKAVLAALNEKFHLDDPLMTQYLDYMKGVVQGDFGPSFKHPNVMVIDRIKEGLPYTAKIGLISIFFSLVIGIPLGILAALKQNKAADRISMIIATLGVTIPSFIVATLLIYVFAVQLGWFNARSGQMTNWKEVFLPVLALSGYGLAFITRLTRSSMLDVIQQDYIRTARAKGISEGKVIFKHGLKNAVLPVVSFIGPLIAFQLVGSFIVERLFSIPGIGRYFTESISNRDYTMIMGTTIFYGILMIVLGFVVEIAYGFLDPRIKFGSVKEAA